MKNLHLEVITPSKAAFVGEIQSVTVPGSSGNFQVLFNHASIISSLEIGVVKVVGKDNSEDVYATSGGTVEILNNRVLVLAETFERADQIDFNRAAKAKERAKERLVMKKDAKIDLDRAEFALKKSINRLKLQGK